MLITHADSFTFIDAFIIVYLSRRSSTEQTTTYKLVRSHYLTRFMYFLHLTVSPCESKFDYFIKLKVNAKFHTFLPSQSQCVNHINISDKDAQFRLFRAWSPPASISQLYTYMVKFGVEKSVGQQNIPEKCDRLWVLGDGTSLLSTAGPLFCNF